MRAATAARGAAVGMDGEAIGSRPKRTSAKMRAKLACESIPKYDSPVELACAVRQVAIKTFMEYGKILRPHHVVQNLDKSEVLVSLRGMFAHEATRL